MAEKKAVLIVLALITGFIFLLSFSTYYVKDAIDKGRVCGCMVPVPLMLVLLGSLGVFVGSLVSYFFFCYIEQKNPQHSHQNKATDVLFCLFSPDERKVIKTLMKGKQRQSTIAASTNLSRVKVHRIIERFVQKGIVEKDEEGVALKEDIDKLFC